jgi:hypothetical protein
MSLPREWVPTTEAEALKRVLEMSPEFQGYYRAERSKIPFPIVWVRDERMPRGINFRVSRIDKGSERIYYVRLRTVPVSVGHAMNVAHELNHFIMRAEGFPTLGAPAGTGLETLASSISSMIQDPMVNGRLVPYGFDLRADHEEEVEDSIRQMTTLPVPNTKLDRLHWVVNMAGKVLDAELAGVAPDEDRFEAFVRSKFPHLVAQRDSLLRTVRRIGYATPMEQQRLFTEIMRRYKLPPAIHISPP